MHLSECVDLFSDTNKIDYHVRSCISGWLFKSTTEFYGWENSRLGLNYMFGALCWSYTVMGITMFSIRPSWTKNTSFPHFLSAFLFTFIQGPLSFLADYLNMTNDSIFHVIDRFMAIINLSFAIWRVFALYHHARPGIFYCHLCTITFAIFCFMNSQDAQIDKDADAFIFWHNFWHTCPFFSILTECFDHFYLGEFDNEMNTRENAMNADDVVSHNKLTLWSLWTEFKTTTLFGVGLGFEERNNEEKKLK